jgi:transcriptional regulator with XRE-family HTH domain
MIMTIGERIEKRRKELRMTQDELAKKVGYASRSSINKIEKARILPAKKIVLMSEALSCSPSYLMGWIDENKPHFLLDGIAKEDNPSEFDEKLVKSFIELTTDNEDERELLKGFRCASTELKETMLNIARQALKKDSESLKEA